MLSKVTLKMSFLAPTSPALPHEALSLSQAICTAGNQELQGLRNGAQMEVPSLTSCLLSGKKMFADIVFVNGDDKNGRAVG